MPEKHRLATIRMSSLPRRDVEEGLSLHQSVACMYVEATLCVVTTRWNCIYSEGPRDQSSSLFDQPQALLPQLEQLLQDILLLALVLILVLVLVLPVALDASCCRGDGGSNGWRAGATW